MASQRKVVIADEKRKISLQNERGDGLQPFADCPPRLRGSDRVSEKVQLSSPLYTVVEWCNSEMNVKDFPPEGGVYFHHQVLVLRMHLPLTDFVSQVLAYYNVALIQLTSSAWRTNLSSEALCVDFAVLRILHYSMRRLSYEA